MPWSMPKIWCTAPGSTSSTTMRAKIRVQWRERASKLLGRGILEVRAHGPAWGRQGLRGAWSLLEGLGRMAWRYRRILVAVAVRAAWWGSLAIFLHHMTALANYDGPLLPTLRQHGFTWGAVLCVFVVLLGERRYLRVLGGLLGWMHGAMALLMFSELNG